MKTKKHIATIILTLGFLVMNSVTAFAADTTVYSQIDTSSMPYRDSPSTYLISSDAVLTWKKYNTVLGYDETGTQKNADATVEVYENRQGNSGEGMLNYAWTLDGSLLDPILAGKKGPIPLGITLSQSANGLMIAFASTRDFDGKIKIKLNISSYYKNGNKLSLTYINGVDDSQIHGTDGTVPSSSAETVPDIEVQDGFVTFTISKGGNYILNKVEGATPATEPVSTEEPKILDNVEGTGSGTTVLVNKEELNSKVISESGTVALSNTDTNTVANKTANTESKTSAVDDKESPATGQEQHGLVFVLCFLLAGAGVVGLSKKEIL